MNAQLLKRIEEGESRYLDFKYCISDSRKIARSISAFANTDGGSLLIGVRDNGSIAGVQSEEEFFMIENAFLLYCKPEIPWQMQQYSVEKRTVVEVKIPRASAPPYYAKGEDNKWWAYIRYKDENHLASTVMLKVWKRQQQNKGILLKYGKAEELLLNCLKEKPDISLPEFRKLARLTKPKAENILANLLILKIIDYRPVADGYRYFALPQQDLG